MIASKGRSGLRLVPARYSPYLFAVIQSGLTCAIAATFASSAYARSPSFASHWLALWLESWAFMVPVVIIAAPVIRRLIRRLTY